MVQTVPISSERSGAGVVASDQFRFGPYHLSRLVLSQRHRYHEHLGRFFVAPKAGINFANELQITVANRPNPKFELGAVDCSCAIVLCDLLQKDKPIVYASEGFCELTGYSLDEILGRNCRFLQSPDGNAKSKSTQPVDKEAIRKLRKAVNKNEEIQMEIVNFKKGGQKFKNFMTVIPIRWDGVDNRYAVGFQVEVD